MTNEEKRIIKKYANRRLYDMETGEYVTLKHLKELVIERVRFRVVTNKNEDVTMQTLMSVLLSEEVMGQPVFSEQNLRNIIMSMNGPMRGAVRVFLEQCMPIFEKSQQQLTEKFGVALGANGVENLAMLQSNFVRQMMEMYVCRGLENYLASQKSLEKLAAQTFSVQDAFNPIKLMAAAKKKKGKSEKKADAPEM